MRLRGTVWSLKVIFFVNGLNVVTVCISVVTVTCCIPSPLNSYTEAFDEMCPLHIKSLVVFRAKSARK